MLEVGRSPAFAYLGNRLHMSLGQDPEKRQRKLASGEVRYKERKAFYRSKLSKMLLKSQVSKFKYFKCLLI